MLIACLNLKPFDLHLFSRHNKIVSSGDRDNSSPVGEDERLATRRKIFDLKMDLKNIYLSRSDSISRIMDSRGNECALNYS